MALNADKQTRLKQAVRDTAFGRTLAVGAVEFQDTTITSAQLLALRATPIAVVAAPGVGRFLEFIKAELYLPAQGTGYTESTANLGIKYTNGAGAQVSGTVESTGFIDQTTVQLRLVGTIVPQTGATTGADITPVANAALVLHNLGAGEITGGTGSLLVRVYFRTMPSVLPSATE